MRENIFPQLLTRSLYFYSDHSGAGQVWKMPAAGGEPIQVTKQGGNEPMESPDGRFIYYHKVDAAPKMWGMGSIWKIPVASGLEEERVLDGVPEGHWAIGEQSIYYINRKVKPHTIELYSLVTGKVRKIATVEKDLYWGAPGLAVSADDQWLLYSPVDIPGSNIMVVDNFH